MRKLGKSTRSLLEAMHLHGYYGPQCGWRWKCPKTTLDTLDHLFMRGLVDYHSSLTIKRRMVYGCYVITDAGREALKREDAA